VANVFRNPYSNVAGNTPPSLGNGQLGVNQADGRLFYRSAAGAVTTFSSIASFATTASFPDTGSSSVLYLASDTSRVYQFANGVYVEVGVASGYTLPNATTSTLGGVVVGAGLSVASGTVTANVVSVAGRTGAISIEADDVSGLGSLATQSSVAYSSLTGTPTSFSPSSHGHVSSDVTVAATDRLLGRSSAGAGSVEEIVCTAYGRSLLDDADAATARTTMGLGTIATAASNAYLPISGGTLTGMTTISVAAGATLNLTATAGTGQVSQLTAGEMYITNYVSGKYILYQQVGAGSHRFFVNGSEAAQVNQTGITVVGEVRLNGSTSGYVSLQSPATATSHTYTLPSATGAAGQVLTTNGSGVLSWATDSRLTKTIASFTARDNHPPATNFATLDTRNSVLVLEFDAATEESATFIGVVNENATLTNGLTVRLWWMGDTATSGNVRWGVQFEDTGTDLDANSYDTNAQATSAASGTSGIESVASITITTIDSLTAGDRFRLRVYRVAADATNDTMTGDAQLVAVEVRAA
jgi:hypothetical protein